jgi:hypothetical protein
MQQLLIIKILTQAITKKLMNKFTSLSPTKTIILLTPLYKLLALIYSK